MEGERDVRRERERKRKREMRKRERGRNEREKTEPPGCHFRESYLHHWTGKMAGINRSPVDLCVAVSLCVEGLSCGEWGLSPSFFPLSLSLSSSQSGPHCHL